MLHTDFKERKWEEIFTLCVTVNEFRGDSAVRYMNVYCYVSFVHEKHLNLHGCQISPKRESSCSKRDSQHCIPQNSPRNEPLLLQLLLCLRCGSSRLSDSYINRQLNGFLYLHLHGDRKVICNRYGFHTFFNKIDIETFMKKLDIMEFNPLTITCNIFFNS